MQQLLRQAAMLAVVSSNCCSEDNRISIGMWHSGARLPNVGGAINRVCRSYRAARSVLTDLHNSKTIIQPSRL
ncbi:hypothetical protein K505DRAFT_78789 [Melanomma pulvis-pyrius CBS 109.77]|uniref:Uncharacterized protein n=1 Tax=Melanomma pulvis-pyrius CBS 109.77 TaxID=1314802 RepID=A0A6A6X2T5_9PLEO|nr:hypothetical protein K505DRAFT_78789 [Melanomma pulvis-pyrius CBS 109.77]